MKKFLAEMKTAGNTVILFIDELHNVVGLVRQKAARSTQPIS